MALGCKDLSHLAYDTCLVFHRIVAFSTIAELADIHILYSKKTLRSVEDFCSETIFRSQDNGKLPTGPVRQSIKYLQYTIDKKIHEITLETSTSDKAN